MVRGRLGATPTIVVNRPLRTESKKKPTHLLLINAVKVENIGDFIPSNVNDRGASANRFRLILAQLDRRIKMHSTNSFQILDDV